MTRFQKFLTAFAALIIFNFSLPFWLFTPGGLFNALAYFGWCVASGWALGTRGFDYVNTGKI